jgi:hypothetical protein
VRKVETKNVGAREKQLFNHFATAAGGSQGNNLLGGLAPTLGDLGGLCDREKLLLCGGGGVAIRVGDERGKTMEGRRVKGGSMRRKGEMVRDKGRRDRYCREKESGELHGEIDESMY